MLATFLRLEAAERELAAARYAPATTHRAQTAKGARVAHFEGVAGTLRAQLSNAAHGEYLRWLSERKDAR